MGSRWRCYVLNDTRRDMPALPVSLELATAQVGEGIGPLLRGTGGAGGGVALPPFQASFTW